jgi:hypothetical protein
MEENLPPGFRFHPTDEELITNYLTMKISDSSFTSKAVAVVDLNKSEPWDLPGRYTYICSCLLISSKTIAFNYFCSIKYICFIINLHLWY